MGPPARKPIRKGVRCALIRDILDRQTPSSTKKDGFAGFVADYRLAAPLGSGREECLNELIPLLDWKLRRIAHHLMRKERQGHTLQLVTGTRASACRIIARTAVTRARGLPAVRSEYVISPIRPNGVWLKGTNAIAGSSSFKSP
jgi:hypothetical protein